MAKQLDMFDYKDATFIAPNTTPRTRARTEKRVAKLTGKPVVHPPTIDQRFQAFVTANPHVMQAALALARCWLDRGDKYISTKRIYEELRTRVRTEGDASYRLNNDFTAPLSRWLQEQESRLVGVVRIRERKS